MHAQLRHLAILHRVQTSYRNVFGELKVAPEETLRGILAARGVACSTDREIRDSLDAARSARARRFVAPVHVVWLPGGRRSVRINDRSLQQIDCEIVDELGEARFAERVHANGGEIALPSLDAGYHTLRIASGSQSGNCALFVAPTAAWTPHTPLRTWGTFAPLYAASSNESWGAGDLADARRLVDWTRSLGGSIVAMLPISASFLDDRIFEPSPYAPASRLFWNELYADRDKLTTADEEVRALIDAARHSALVDYASAMRAKRCALEASLANMPADEREQYERFCASDPDLDRYAAFRAASERHGAFHSWPDGELPDYDRSAFEYHRFAQFTMERQLRDLRRHCDETSVRLYLDFPLGTHRESYDVWRHREIFVDGASVGAPPDHAYATGQDWGFPPLDPLKLRASGYRYLIDCVRRQLRFAHILRIDHVMGLHRLYWIPQGCSAKDGAYVRYHADELYAILSIESHRAKSMIIGEDLGTVPKYVREAIDEHRLRRLFVLQRQLTHERVDPPGTIAPNMLASVNNHDMPPFASFWAGTDIDDRRAIGLINADEAAAHHERRQEIREFLTRFLQHRNLLSGREDPLHVLKAALEFLARSEAEVVLVSAEDLWLETLPQNTPTTTWQRPNWRRKFRFALEEIVGNEQFENILEAVDAARKQGATGDG